MSFYEMMKSFKKFRFLKIFLQTRIDDGRWHRIQVSRKRRMGILQVDKNKPVKGKCLKGTGILHSDGYIWIGKKDNLMEPF
jgi:hypothetical protein